MDEFGVLGESIGFKSQKSAPMAHLKSKPKTNFNFSNGFPQERGISSNNPSRSPRYGDYFVDDLDGIFQSKNNGNSQKTQNFFDAGDDIFGGSFVNFRPQAATQGSIDLDSVFDFNRNSSSKPNSNFYDDILTGPRKGDAIDDLFGDFGMKSESLKKNNQGNGSQFDDLIPGFGGCSASNNGSGNHGLESEEKLSQPSMADDPFLVFESPAADASSLSFSDPLEQNARKGSDETSIDELEKFAMGGVPNRASDKPSGEMLRNIRISLEKKNSKSGQGKYTKAEVLHEKQRNKERVDKVNKEEEEAVINEHTLDKIFGMGPHPGNLNRPSSQTEDSIFDTLFNEKRRSEVKKPSSRPSHNKEKSPSAAMFSDDFSSLFGEATSSSGEFQEIEGESDERRRARLNHHMRTQSRMAKALAEKNQRDLESQYEQEERRRLADSLDYDIKRWSAGKEDNLRALLSSLQDVLWPECGWKPVYLTDLITSTSVKKVYHKATLCVHPDKVQQKGSNLQQKYIAEKVFDLLKEAWNKFSAAELHS